MHSNALAFCFSMPVDSNFKPFVKIAYYVITQVSYNEQTHSNSQAMFLNPIVQKTCISQETIKILNDRFLSIKSNSSHIKISWPSPDAFKAVWPMILLIFQHDWQFLIRWASDATHSSSFHSSAADFPDDWNKIGPHQTEANKNNSALLGPGSPYTAPGSIDLHVCRMDKEQYLRSCMSAYRDDRRAQGQSGSKTQTITVCRL